jgi:Domain of unknown function (DUF4823)
MKAINRIFGAVDWIAFLRYLCVMLLALVVVGCKTHYDATAEYRKHALDPDKRGYVAMAEDALRGNRRVKGSGAPVSDVVYQGFADHLKLVIAGNAPHTQEENFAKARQQECDYLIIPSIVDWVNEDNDFGTARGNIVVSIQVHDVKTEEKLSSVILKTKGPNSPLEDQPADQLAEPLKAYLEALFKK